MASGLSNERVLKKLMEKMNASLPTKRVWLRDLLRSENPSYHGRDGHEYSIEREELILIKNALDASGLKDVKIPILMFADTGHEQSVWRIEGREECAVISHVIGKGELRPRDPTFLYLAHMTLVRRRLPTTTVSVYA